MNTDKIKLMSIEEKKDRLLEIKQRLSEVNYTTTKGYVEFTRLLKEKDYIKSQTK